MQLDRIEGSIGTKTSNKSRLKEALEAATRFYEAYLLHTHEGRTALEYLFARGISLDFIYAFRVGLSPKSEGGLRKYLHQAHFSDEELIEAGLLVERGGKVREFFQERIMFPILDVQNQTIGFSARKMHEATFGGKYINTSETPLFKKSRVLFGLAQSRKRIIKTKQAIIVEGGLDALGMIYNGFDCTVAALGTAFGEDHVHEVCQLGVMKVYLLFDGDTAGQEASVKVGHLFQKRGVEVLVAKLKAGSDPDSLLAEEGTVAITEAMIHAEEYLAFLWGHFSKSLHANSPAEKNKLVQELVQRVRAWDNPVMVHESLKKLAALTKVPEELLGIDVLQTRTIHFKKSLQTSVREQVDPDSILEQDLLRWLILLGQPVFELVSKNIATQDLRVEAAKVLYSQVSSLLAEKKPLDLLKLTADAETDELSLFLSDVLNKKVNRDKAQEALTQTILRIKERNWMHERESIKMKIHSGNLAEDELMELVKQFDALKKQTPTVEP